MTKHHVTNILNGEKIAAQIRERLKKKIEEEKTTPGLAVVLVGHDPASKMYVDFKKQAGEEVGMYLQTHELPEETSQEQVLKLIKKLNKNKKIHGILVQLPLPSHMEEFEVMEAVDPAKDVDGFHPDSIGWLSIGKPRFLPATTRGIWQLLQLAKIDVKGKRVVIVGTSNIVGKPTAQFLLNKGATVTLCHKLTKDIATHTVHADIIISATGVPGLITGKMVKEGVVVIDAGIAKREGETVGDVDYDSVKLKASVITPVPGGVGPMTVVSLLENTYDAMKRSQS